MKKWLIRGIGVLLVIISAGTAYAFYMLNPGEYTNTSVHITMRGEWLRASDSIQESINGETIVTDNKISGEVFADITVSPDFPNWVDAERVYTPSCVVALDDGTMITSGYDKQVGEVRIFPPGIWVVTVVQTNPDRWLLWDYGIARQMFSACRNAASEIAPTLADIPDDDWFVPVDDAHITIESASP